MTDVKDFPRTSETQDERQELIDAIRNGNRGHLIVGQFLQKRFEKGQTNLEHLQAWLRNKGVKLPSEGSRSKYRAAYEAWCRNAGLDLDAEYEHPGFTDDGGEPIPMTLTGASVYSLYEARGLIDREDPVGTLAWVYSSTLDEIKDVASDKTNGRKKEESLKSLPKVPEGVMDSFKALEEHFSDKSRLEVVEFLITFVADLAETDPDTFRQAVLGYFGDEIPEAPQEATEGPQKT